MKSFPKCDRKIYLSLEQISNWTKQDDFNYILPLRLLLPRFQGKQKNNKQNIFLAILWLALRTNRSTPSGTKHKIGSEKNGVIFSTDNSDRCLTLCLTRSLTVVYLLWYSKCKFHGKPQFARKKRQKYVFCSALIVLDSAFWMMKKPHIAAIAAGGLLAQCI